MSTVGLTKAMREALNDVDTLHARSEKFINSLCDLGLIRYGECCGLRVVEVTPRGHAALAAPRMTQAEYDILCAHEGYAEIPFKTEFAPCYNNGWIKAGALTPAGRTALNNVRAAMGSPDWKEGL